jgi:hypothetical protein
MYNAFLQANTGSGWFDLPLPSEYQPTYTHLEDSYRDATGRLHRDITRYNLFKATCGWNKLDSEKMALLQRLYDYKQFRLRCTDNKGNRVEKVVYAGPLDGKTKYVDKNTYLLLKRSNVTMNFIEV